MPGEGCGKTANTSPALNEFNSVSVSGRTLTIILSTSGMRSLSSRVGAPSRTGDGRKLPCSSNSIARGKTCSSTPQCIQDELEHAVIGFRHSGHCSAPRMSVPPFFSALEDAPAPVDFLSLLQADANRTNANSRQKSDMPRRCRLTKTDLLVG